MRQPDEGFVTREEAPAWIARAGDAIARAVSSVGLERSARLIAVAVAPLLLSDNTASGVTFQLGGLAVYVLATAFAPRQRYLRATDLVAGAILLVTSGGALIAFLPFVLVTIAGPASRGGVRAGLAAGSTMAVVLLARLAVTGEFAALGPATLVPISLLLPLSGLTTAVAAEVLADRSVRDRMLLQEAHRLLSSLRQLADEIPGGLDVASVSAALVADLRAIAGVRAAIVLVDDHGMLRAAATTGETRRDLAPLRLDTIAPVLTDTRRFRSPSGLPPAVRDACAALEHWLVLPMGEVAAPTGVLLVGFDRREDGRAARSRLQALAGDGRLALENAHMFDGTRIRAADAARRSVAGDLHDGVAQALAHLRMELELRARGGDADAELVRLARVADSALVDLRATIAGLRAPFDHDLGALLSGHVDNLRSTRGPELVLRVEGANRLDPQRAEEVLRIAQEAISNALRHADATRVEIVLVQEDEEVRLVVRDDGRGLGRASPQGGLGIGLASMRERADRLGGTLELEPRTGGGTRVVLTLPTAPDSFASPASADQADTGTGSRSRRRPTPLRQDRP